MRAVRLADIAYVRAAHHGRRERRDLARKYWSSISALFALYSSPQNWRNGDPIRIIPPGTIGRLGELAGFFAAGVIPDRIRHVAKPGRTLPTPPELRDLSFAVAYVVAAKAKKIQDPTPVKTVSDNYGVNRRTVQGWVATVTPIDIDPAKLLERMQNAGERYKEQGRSQAAIKRRETKRR